MIIKGQHYAYEVDEPTKDEFPVAFIVHDYGYLYDEETGCQSGFFDTEIRAYKGKLFRAIRASERCYGAPGWLPLEDAGYCIDAWGSLGCGNEFSEVATAKSFSGEAAVSATRNRTSGYVVFDGKVWHECGEPMYCIITFGLGHNHGGTGFFVEDHYNPNIPTAHYFNALQREEAVAYGKEIALSRGDTDDVGRIVDAQDNITVLMPEMVHRNPAADHSSGDPFLNLLERLISSSDGITEAGMITIAATAAQIK